jgi:hypothetical protein
LQVAAQQVYLENIRTFLSDRPEKPLLDRFANQSLISNPAENNQLLSSLS